MVEWGQMGFGGASLGDEMVSEKCLPVWDWLVLVEASSSELWALGLVMVMTLLFIPGPVRVFGS